MAFNKFIVPVLLAFAACPVFASAVSTDQPIEQAPAQKDHRQNVKHGREQNPAEYKQWMEQMKNYKHDFLARELNLTADQKEEFFRLYDKREDEKWKLGREVRKMERDIMKKGDEATDLELEKASDAAVELAGRQNEIDRRYHAEFKKILSKRQLFKLAEAERKFQKSLMDHRGK